MVYDIKMRCIMIFMILILPLCLCDTPISTGQPSKPHKIIDIKEDCMACRIYVRFFQQVWEQSVTKTYAGDGTEFEKQRLKKRETVCTEPRYVDACNYMAENPKAQAALDKWLKSDKNKNEISQFVCIEQMGIFCPKYDHEDFKILCNGHGEYLQASDGVYSCYCYAGYEGQKCERCAVNYYTNVTADNILSCLPCHESCAGGCRANTHRDCVACADGYIFDKDKGCIDFNECYHNNRCLGTHFCVNYMGTYGCEPCAPSCDGCYDYGPDMCRKCSKGFIKKGELCMPEEEEDEVDQLTTTRYMTYLGLLIATGILLPKNTSLGGIVGIMVLSYIVGAEYYCMINGHRGLLDLKDYDLMQLFHM